MGVEIGPSDWMKKAKVLTYTRISDARQDKQDRSKKDPKAKPILKQQFDFIQKSLKEKGLPTSNKKDQWFAEVASGANRDRLRWRAMIAEATRLAHSGKRVFIAVKDPSRWARNARHSLGMLDAIHDLGIPVLAVREGIQTGSANDLHPMEELLFIQLSGSAAYVSQEQKKKADESVVISKEKGVMSGSGTSLFPFARHDPIQAYLEQRPLLTVPNAEGGGTRALYGTIGGMTAPNGMKGSSVARMVKREEARRANLDTKAYDDWYQYRKKIRDILIKVDHDPWAVKGNRQGPANWGAKALMHQTGRYLAEPWKYEPRSDEEILLIMKEPFDYLSGKDKDRYRSVVGKR